METITITLNGREVSGQPGMTILDLARESGLAIPTLCHDPNLAPFGACRICIVEDERSGALVASCITPIAPGMVINTQSPRVLERRTTLVELMLASHPDSCPVCDKGNRCQLRGIASELGVGIVRLQRVPQLANIEESNPFIERDLSKCILCAKCIRACEDLVCEGALDYLGRGFASKPATLGNKPLEKSECTFCGTCVAICPTGAIMEKNKSYRGTSATSVRTICPFCGCGCGISLEVKNEQLVRARPDETSPINKGTLCVRGSYGYDFVHSPERLTTPLIKTNGNFEVVSWDEALSLVAAAINKIKETTGSNSLAVFGSSKCTNEENYLIQRFARCVLGTNNVDNGSRLHGLVNISLWQNIGFNVNVKSIDELERSQVILVIGTDPTSSAPLVGYAIKRAIRHKGAKLLLIDPRQTKLAPWAHLWLKPKVATDAVLINSMARVIIDEKLFDKDRVLSNIDGFETLTQVLQPYTQDKAEHLTGVKWEEITRAARLLATAKKVSIVFDGKFDQQINGAAAIASLANLALLTGILNSDGGGLYLLQRENNAQGACDMGSLPDCLPGYQSLTDMKVREKFEGRWGCNLPGKDGITALEMIQLANEGKIKGMYIVGENPATSFPNTKLVKQALNSLDFLVVQDMFLTDTAKLAKVVLPAASFAEKEGTFTNLEGRVQRVRQALKPLGNSLPDWEILLRLADRMGCPMPYTSPKEVMDEIAELAPLYQGISHTQLDTRASHGCRVNYTQLSSEHKRFSAVAYIPQTVRLDEDYPFMLFSGSVLYQFGSGTRTSRSARLKTFLPDTFLEINPTDAKKLRINEGDKVRVASAMGELLAAARITDAVSKGTVFMPVLGSENSVNSLYEIILDPETKTPTMRSCPVRLERVSGNG